MNAHSNKNQLKECWYEHGKDGNKYILLPKQQILKTENYTSVLDTSEPFFSK